MFPVEGVFHTQVMFPVESFSHLREAMFPVESLAATVWNLYEC